MDTSSPKNTRSNRTPWEILGVKRGAKWEEIRSAFLKKARQLHPDKGGDQKQFQELRTAYDSLNEVMNDDQEEEPEVWEEIEKWVDWAGRWGKRLFGTELSSKNNKKEAEILRIQIPWKLLEDRTQSIKVEYDGWPIKVPLNGTEIVGAIGLRVRIIPKAEYKTIDISGNEIIHAITYDPWRKDTCWLYDIPKESSGFRIHGGDWMTIPGEYGRGVYWRIISSF
jgi:hypothetical protein